MMETRRILPYIPFSSALTWQDVPEEEVSKVGIHTAFHPEWFAQRSSVEFGERWHTDYEYRHWAFVEMAKVLNGEFKELGVDYDLSKVPYGISQIFGCSVMGALFGLDIKFNNRGYTDNSGEALKDGNGEIIEPENLKEHPVLKNILTQMEDMAAHAQVPDGILNLQGILNTAFRAQGQDIFVDMIENQDRVRAVFEKVFNVMLEVINIVYSEQRKHQLERNYFVTSNCTVNMISGEQYSQHVLPFDSKFAQEMPYFGIHNCGWCVDEYIDAYATIENLAYLDFGIDSDLTRIKNSFKGPITLSPIFNPSDVSGVNSKELYKILDKICNNLGECQIILGDLGADFPSETVIDFYKAVAEVWQVPVDSLLSPFPDSF